jgi:hypothetical protein
MAGLIALEHAAESEPQPLGGMRAQDDAIGEFDLDAAVVRNIPGLVGAEEQVDLLLRALDVDDVGEVGRHLGVVPVDRGKDGGILRGRLLGLFSSFRCFCRHDLYSPMTK